MTETIEWNDATWNPVRGCTKVSPGCDHCYAERIALRRRGIPGDPYELGFVPREVPDNLDQPLRWKRPRRVLVASMGDLFHEDLDAGFVRQVFETMLVAQWHVFQVLTRRPERMRALVRGLPRELADQPHIWMGVSVEDRAHGVPRIDALRDVPAAVRFVCFEPLLEDLGELELSGIHSVVVGGESGQGARPMRAEWVHAIRQQCEAQGVAFFFKGWGGPRRELTGRLLDGRMWEELPLAAGAVEDSPWPA
ncbi:MAG: phage Gp37/Gp68 family protein [Kofleriaceae bacterium]|nr:MAG: phage Gp37/Gp68 family protein [Kofleriaceae bacterium]MBZ0235351.1 phage Gp37/Gp68 family protein [Kofleriaceae bacterium]